MPQRRDEETLSGLPKTQERHIDETLPLALSIGNIELMNLHGRQQSVSSVKYM